MGILFNEVTDHTTRKFQTCETAGVVTFKQNLIKFIQHHNIFHRANSFQKILKNTLLNQKNMKNTNDMDALITSGMLMSERKKKTRLNHCPWSPTLEATILEVNLWKIIISDIENDVSKKYKFKES